MANQAPGKVVHVLLIHRGCWPGYTYGDSERAFPEIVRKHLTNFTGDLCFRCNKCLEQWGQENKVMSPLTENWLQYRKESHYKADYHWLTRNYLRQSSCLLWGCHFIILIRAPFKVADNCYCQTRVVERVYVSIIDYFSPETSYYF